MKKIILWVFEAISVLLLSIIPKFLPEKIYFSIIPLIIILSLRIYEKKTEEYENVLFPVQTLYEIMNRQGYGGIRITIHIVEKKGKQYKQKFNYYPGGTGAKRKYSTEKGIVGVSIKDKQKKIESFQNDKEYREKMHEKYNYTNEEMLSLTTTRRSYLSYPILEGPSHEVKAVLYIDSPEINVFTFMEDDSNILKKIIEITISNIKKVI